MLVSGSLAVVVNNCIDCKGVIDSRPLENMEKFASSKLPLPANIKMQKQIKKKIFGKSKSDK